MKQTQWTVGAALLCMTVTAVAVAAPAAAKKTASTTNTAAVRQALQAAYNRSDAAAMRKDAKGTFAHLSSNFVAVQGGRKISRERILQEGTAVFQQAQSIQSKTKVQSVVMKGSKAIATVSAMGKLVVNDGSGRSVPVTINTTSRDTWVNAGGTWKMTQSTLLSQR